MIGLDHEMRFGRFRPLSKQNRSASSRRWPDALADTNVRSLIAYLLDACQLVAGHYASGARLSTSQAVARQSRLRLKATNGRLGWTATQLESRRLGGYDGAALD